MPTQLDEAVGQVLLAIANKLNMNNPRDALWIRAALEDVIREELRPFLEGR